MADEKKKKKRSAIFGGFDGKSGGIKRSFLSEINALFAPVRPLFFAHTIESTCSFIACEDGVGSY